MFRIVAQPLDPSSLKVALLDPQAGACVIFEGWARNHNEGRQVQYLEYEAYAKLAEAEGAAILAEAEQKFPIQAAVCLHRVGRLQIGDLAVWVGVCAAHRGAAFEACRYLIDEVKARVPIWKKEHYASGASEWINCATKGPGAGVQGQ
ncbi:MAG: molybdenum cofactor biosynthesis protein MoaE [Opitutales bacterium]